MSVVAVTAVAAAVAAAVIATLVAAAAGMLRATALAAVAGIAYGRTMRLLFAGGRDGHADHALDIAQEHAFLLVAERDGDAVGAGPRGAADAVDIAFGHVRQVVVDDVADAVDVDAAGGNVGRDQDAQLAAFEVGEHALTLVLRLVAVDRGGEKAVLFEAFHDLVGAVLGAGEDQNAIGLLRLEHVDQ